MVTSETSTYEVIHAIVDRAVFKATEKQMSPQHQQLIAIIESGRHLLIGAKALAAHMEQRFTKDTDYLVGRRVFQRVRKWLIEQGIEFKDGGEAVLIEPLAIDVLDANNHPVLKEILKKETGIPSIEALAVMKYVAILGMTRSPQKRYQDISDFVGLVSLERFRADAFLAYLVDRYEEQRPQAAEVIEKIKRGERHIVI